MPQQAQQFGRCLHDVGAGAEDRHGAHRAQEIIILRWDDAAGDHLDIAAARRFQLVDQGGHERLVAGGQAGRRHQFHIQRDGQIAGLLRRLEQRADRRIEPEIGQRGADHLGAAVMAVLAHFHDQHARLVAGAAFKGLNALRHAHIGRIGLVAIGVNALHHLHHRNMPAEHGFHRGADFAQSGAGAGAFDGQGQHIVLRRRASGQRGQRRLDPGGITRRLHRFDAGDLAGAHGDIVDIQHRKFVGGFRLVLVHAHDHGFAHVDAGLLGGGCRFNLQLGHAGGDRLGHAAQILDLVDNRLRIVHQLLGQRLDIIAAAQRIDDLGDAGLFLQHDLGVAGDARRKIGGQRNGFVQRIGVQALRAAHHRRQRLDGGADDVVVRVLLGQANTAGLAVRAQHQAARVLGAEIGHDARPQRAGGAQFRHFHEEIHADGEEKAQAAGKFINIQALFLRRTHIFHAIGQGEGQLLQRGRPGFVHMIAGDGNTVEFRHVARRVRNNVGHDPHRWLRRVDIGVADHELLEDVVLHRAIKQRLRHAGFLGRDNEKRQARDDRAVHRHRNGHLVERNPVEQDLHVLHGIDRHPGLANIA